MADNYNDQELSELFRKRLPPQPIPPELSQRITQRVLAEVAAMRESQFAQEPLSQSSLPQTVANARPQPARHPTAKGGIWEAFWSELRARLTFAPSLVVSMATAALVLFVVLYGRDYLGGMFDVMPGQVQTGSQGIETLPDAELASPTPAVETPVAEISLADDETPTELPDTVEPPIDEEPTLSDPETPTESGEASVSSPAASVEGSSGLSESEPTAETGEELASGALPNGAVPTSEPIIVEDILPTQTPAPDGQVILSTPTPDPLMEDGASEPVPTNTNSRTPTRMPNGNAANNVTRMPGRTPAPTRPAQSGEGNGGSLLPTVTPTPGRSNGNGVVVATPTRPSATPLPQVRATATRTLQQTPVLTPTSTQISVRTRVPAATTSQATSTTTPRVLMGTPNAPTATVTNTPIPPTFTPTATATDTPIPPTFTPTATATDTPIPPTFTPTATATNTPVPPTFTPTATATNTNTPIPPTFTPTATATDTPIPTATDTPVPTATATDTPVPTATDTPVPTNAPPVANPYSYGLQGDGTYNILRSRLIESVYDDNGWGNLQWTGLIGNQSEQGGQVNEGVSAEGQVLVKYQPPPHLLATGGEDRFYYTVIDAHGAAATGMVIVNVAAVPPTATPPPPPTATQLPSEGGAEDTPQDVNAAGVTDQGTLTGTEVISNSAAAP